MHAPTCLSLFVLLLVWPSIVASIPNSEYFDVLPLFDVNGGGHSSIQAFSEQYSILPGEQISFKVRTHFPQYTLRIFRVGYPIQLLHTHSVQTVHGETSQPRCTFEAKTATVDCSNWSVSSHWPVPSTAVSGLYVAKVSLPDHTVLGKTETWRTDASEYLNDVRFSNVDIPFTKPKPVTHAYGARGLGALRNPIIEPYASHVYFVVRSNSSHDILVQTSDFTWNAYNDFDDGYNSQASTYGSRFNSSAPRVLRASFNRPLTTRSFRPVNAPLGPEMAMFRFLDKQGFNYSVITGRDMDNEIIAKSTISKHQVFLSSGHDEYWSGPQRKHVEWARDILGISLFFASGNQMFWRVRYEPLSNSMVITKESSSGKRLDPLPETEWTGTWRSEVGNPLGAQPENSVSGLIYVVNAWRADPLIIDERFQSMRFYRNIDFCSISTQPYITRAGILGHEWDVDLDNGFRPQGLIHVSETGPIDNVWYIMDEGGGVYDTGSAVHNLVFYRNPMSQSRVFGTGTVQWAYGLDDVHDDAALIPGFLSNPINIRVGQDLLGVDRVVQQLTLNVLADMGAFAKNPENGLVSSPNSVDEIPPKIVVVQKIDGVGSDVQIEVEAHDVGGVIGSVEYSLQDGVWHPAHPVGDGKRTAPMKWTFSCRLCAMASVRAIDDSGLFSDIKTFILPKSEL